MQAETTLQKPNENIYIVIDNKVSELKKEFITLCLKEICMLNNLMHLDINKLSDKVYSYLKKFNTIDDINKQIIMTASEMVTEHYDYPSIATFILLHDLHSKTNDDYVKTVKQMRANLNPKGESAPLVSNKFAKYVYKNKHAINKILANNKNRDYKISLFGYRTLEKAYLKKLSNGKIIERPQYLFMRTALAIHHRKNDFAKVEETYDLMSEGYLTHATPTLFNAGTSYEQLSSCFLLGTADDMGRIGDCWKDCGLISKHAGGIGINMTSVRVNGAYINSTQGTASGLKVLSVFNEISRYADQSGKRPGSIAIYIEPWHADIFFFLDLKKNTGAETERARDLFLGLTINDIFMERVEADGIWSLMCPHDCPNLLDKFGDGFSNAYREYETSGNFIKQVSARELWFKILETQIETGVPYMLYKDAVNKKSNQINIGVVNGSNLCVSGDTMILTSKGYVNIRETENQSVDVWNGAEFSNVTIKKTGVEQELIQISFSNGCILKCTQYHKFYIMDDNNKTVEKRASELVMNEKLIKTSFPIIKNGLDIAVKYIVPINHNIDIKISWFGSLLDKDNATVNEHNKSVQITSINKKFLNDVLYMLQTMGCEPEIILNNDIYILRLYSNDVNCLLNLGLKTSKLELSNIKNSVSQTDHFVTVTGLVHLNEKEDTFCFTEPLKNMGIFNGIITGQCCEIVEVHTADEIAVCNLASICLPKFVENGEFNHQKLFNVAKIATRNLNNIIDINFYPVEKARISNMRHRPIGLGVQGLADTFFKLKYPFDSPKARELNKRIFETIYFGALTESCLMAKESGYYSTYPGSPLSQGKFQFDLWDVPRDTLVWDWESLWKDIKEYGVRNSLTTAEMPTASTSQIMGNTETIEAITSNIYTRKTIAGDYYVINKYLMVDLMELGLWDSDMIDMIKYYEGSIQNIPGIPDDIKEIYRTVYEIDQMSIIDMAVDRGAFVDQTQSLNLHIAEPNFARLNSCHFYGWKRGLKTGMYYLRSKPASEASKFGIDVDTIRKIEERDGIIRAQQIEISEPEFKSCPYNPNRKNNAECLMCGS